MTLSKVKTALLILSIAANFLLGGFIYQTLNNPNKLNYNVTITANHLGELKGYTKVYSDEDMDLAYYLKNDREYTTLRPQYVKIAGLDECMILGNAEPGKFWVMTETPEKIEAGMSGRRVYDLTGKPIGFISALTGDKLLECRTLE